MLINYLNCLQKAATPLTVSSGRQRQAAENFDASPYVHINALINSPYLMVVIDCLLMSIVINT